MIKGEIRIEGLEQLEKFTSRVDKCFDVMNRYAAMSGKGLPQHELVPSAFTKTELITGTDEEQKRIAEYRNSLPKSVRDFFAAVRSKISGALE